MKLYCNVCSIEYDTVMGDTQCPICGRDLETQPRANRTYRVIATA